MFQVFFFYFLIIFYGFLYNSSEHFFNFWENYFSTSCQLLWIDRVGFCMEFKAFLPFELINLHFQPFRHFCLDFANVRQRADFMKASAHTLHLNVLQTHVRHSHSALQGSPSSCYGRLWNCKFREDFTHLLFIWRWKLKSQL